MGGKLKIQVLKIRHVIELKKTLVFSITLTIRSVTIWFGPIFSQKKCLDR